MNEPWFSTQYLYLILHVFGTALGAGAAFTGDSVFLTSIRNKVLTSNDLRILKLTARIIWIGLAVLILSGIGLVSERPEIFLHSQKFWAKMTIVAVITINGFIFHFIHFPILKSKLDKNLTDTHPIIKKRTFLILSGSISVISWSMAIILGVFGRMPFTYLQFMGVYFLVLGVAGVCAFSLRKKIIST